MINPVDKPFNVTILQPAGYIYSASLAEAAEYIHHSLLALGHTSALTTNQLDPARINIVFCAHLLKPHETSWLPPDSIIFNSEQLDNTDGWYLKTGAYQEILRKHYVLDYASCNLAKISHERKSFVPFGFCDKLIRRNMKRRPGNALVFYGIVTPRREKIIKSIQSHGVPVNVITDTFGFKRDIQMFKSWAILNLHNADDTQAFEQIRCFYPLTNGIPVISEASPDDASRAVFEDSIFFFERNELAKACAQYHKVPEKFKSATQQKLDAYRNANALTAIATAIENYRKMPVSIF
jgi:hypothetical protein